MSKPPRQIHSVAEVNRKARRVLEGGISELWVEGELSRVTVHGSGHWYFTLKDETAAVSCAMFARENAGVSFVPKGGMKVVLLARPSLYEVRGDYQLIASEMEEAGLGSLQQHFEELKIKLKKEGLFDPSRKQTLPLLPRRIGVVTSPTGAAIRDIINVLMRRFPNIGILLAPVTVQGPEAKNHIARAIAYLNTRNDIDVLIVGRGGGSIEDLWAFNEEVVARAIAASSIPIISAVGHEIDFTIADFVADVRAPTPSSAAELAVRKQAKLQQEVTRAAAQLRNALRTRAQELRIRFNSAAHHPAFREPASMIARHRRDLTFMQQRLGELLQHTARERTQRLERASLRRCHALQSGVRQAQQRVDEISLVMQHLIEQGAGQSRMQLSGLERQLGMLNPLAVLSRGYSLTRKPDGTVVRHAEAVTLGDTLLTRLANGSVVSKVEKTLTIPATIKQVPGRRVPDDYGGCT